MPGVTVPLGAAVIAASASGGSIAILIVGVVCTTMVIVALLCIILLECRKRLPKKNGVARHEETVDVELDQQQLPALPPQVSTGTVYNYKAVHC